MFNYILYAGGFWKHRKREIDFKCDQYQQLSISVCDLHKIVLKLKN